MKKLLRFLPIALCAGLLLYAGCSGGDEPKSFDCDKSDLQVSLLLNGAVDPTSCSANDGSLEAEATGGKGPYKFSIGAGSFGNDALFSNLGPGSFTISVKDGNGCIRSFDTSLEAPGSPTATLDAVADTQCLDPHNGSITVNASGGAGSFEYKIGDGTFGLNATFNNLTAGLYTIAVKDAAGCVITFNKTVAKGPTGIDYDNDILPIFEENCLIPTCHLNNENGNGNWGIYAEAKNKASAIKSRTQSGDMPRTGSLTASEKALIACWVDGGAPKN